MNETNAEQTELQIKALEIIAEQHGDKTVEADIIGAVATIRNQSARIAELERELLIERGEVEAGDRILKDQDEEIAQLRAEVERLKTQLAEREEDRAAAVREASIERERAGSIKAQNIYLHGLVLKLEAVIKEAWDSAECGYILDAETHQCGMCNGGVVPRTQDVPHDEGCFQAILEPAFAIRAARAQGDGK